MALYLVGDIQGCYDELQALLKKIQFDPKKDNLWALGDIVARGPKSLETIRYLKDLGNSFNMVLGNHDLHLMSIFYGIKKAKSADLLQPLLDAPDLPDIIHWLKQKPLLLQTPDNKGFLSHAGLSPQWSTEEALANAKFAQKKLQSDELPLWLSTMYGETPNNWADADSKQEKFRYIINAFTRMRYCYLDGSLEFKCKQQLKHSPENLKPWFLFLDNNLRLSNDEHWIFGHWASLLGHCPVNNVHALDTGCVWGNTLTAMRWEDKKLFSVNAQKMD